MTIIAATILAPGLIERHKVGVNEVVEIEYTNIFGVSVNFSDGSWLLYNKKYLFSLTCSRGET